MINYFLPDSLAVEQLGTSVQNLLKTCRHVGISSLSPVWTNEVASAAQGSGIPAEEMQGWTPSNQRPQRGRGQIVPAELRYAVMKARIRS
jgi:hypothetical protein